MAKKSLSQFFVWFEGGGGVVVRRLTDLLLTLSSCCCCIFVWHVLGWKKKLLPDWIFHNFRAFRLWNRRILFISGTLCDGCSSTKVVKGSVGYITLNLAPNSERVWSPFHKPIPCTSEEIEVCRRRSKLSKSLEGHPKTMKELVRKACIFLWLSRPKNIAMPINSWVGSLVAWFKCNHWRLRKKSLFIYFEQ